MSVTPAIDGEETGAPVRAVRLPRGERRAQLLSAARDVFVSRGFHATSMDDIAEAAGVTKPVLYQHFESKLELYLALLDDSIDALLAGVREGLESTTDNKQRVAATMAAYLEFVSAESGAFRLVFESDLTNEPEVRERLDQVDDACAELVRDVIMVDTGLSAAESMLLAAGLTGTALSAARHWFRDGRTVSREQAERLIASLAWKGIASFPLTHSTPEPE